MMLALTLPIHFYKRKRYRIVVCLLVLIIGLSLIANIEIEQSLNDVLLMWINIGAFIIWLAILYWLIKGMIKPKPCIELTKDGILFRDYTQPQGKFFAWQEIQTFDYIFDSAFTISIYLNHQTLLDMPQRFECGFYLKINQQQIHAKQTADLLNQALICQREQRPIELMLNPIPLTLMDRWNSLLYHNSLIRNLR